MADDVATTNDAENSAATGEDELGDAGKRALDRERESRKQADTRAKSAEERAGALEKELAKLRRQNLSESERAIEEARAASRAETAAEFGQRLARREFDALAARRNPDVNTDAVLEYVDLGRFVGEDGEPDSKAIAAAVERLVAEPSSAVGVPSLDLGVRSTSAGKGRSNGDVFADLINDQLRT